MIENGRCGWFYRVIREGFVQAGDAVSLVELPNPAWSVARFAAPSTSRGFRQQEWMELAALPELAENWRLTALKHS